MDTEKYVSELHDQKLSFAKRWSQNWSLRRKLICCGIALGIVIAIAVGLGVGLALRNSSGGQGEEPTTTPIPTGNTTLPSSIWQPKAGVTWDYELLYPLNQTIPNVEVYDIDLFDNSISTIRSLQKNGSKVICYFSAGSYENWRSDATYFDAADLGKNLDGWEGEKWINVSSPNVRTIMAARLKLAAAKGCDGVDPDNIDGYNNDNGLNLTKQNAIDYIAFLAETAHGYNMSLGLKNSGEIVGDVINVVQWSVNEQCVQYDECDLYMPFIEAGKPVFHVEYPKGASTNNNIDVSTSTYSNICSSKQAAGFSTIIKNMKLDNWIQTCSDS